MNDAINDPSTLQDSLLMLTKQFVQFDDKTKSFKINPQGMLTLAHERAEFERNFINDYKNLALL